jgi:phosphoglycerate dehydrogenase-like enzyme
LAELRIAVLDDYQQVAHGCADWSSIPGAETVFFSDHLTDEDALVECLAEFDVLVVMRERTPLSRALLSRLPRIRLIVTTATRNASIDVPAASDLGIVVCGTRHAQPATAELTWGLIISLLRRIPAEDRLLREGGWQANVGGDLSGSTLGVLGLGRLGSRVARVGLAFEMDVIAWSENLTDQRAAAAGAVRVGKDELFSRADVLTIHTLLSGRTRGLVGASELALMKPTGVIVNTSRGPIIDEAALLDALREGRIAGAALDVFDQEPLAPDHELRRSRNTVLTPHLGYVTRNSYATYYQDAVEDIRAFLDGAALRMITGSQVRP